MRTNLVQKPRPAVLPIGAAVCRYAFASEGSGGHPHGEPLCTKRYWARLRHIIKRWIRTPQRALKIAITFPASSSPATFHAKNGLFRMEHAIPHTSSVESEARGAMTMVWKRYGV